MIPALHVDRPPQIPNARALNRRQVLAGAGLLGLAAGLTVPSGGGSTTPGSSSEAGLAGLAAQKGLFFGTATQSRYLVDDSAFASLVWRECACLAPEWEMKWQPIQPKVGEFSPEGMDRLADLSSGQGVWLRGHTLFWHESLPDWFNHEVQSKDDWNRIVAPYVSFVASRYGAKLRHWDIINEAINPQDKQAGQLRNWRLSQLFGEDYIIRAFDLARSSAPEVKLFYNDYGLEYASGWHEERRTAVLKALERWRRADVPIAGFGIQGHLTSQGDTSIPQRRLGKFLSEIAALGLEIVVSELDVGEGNFNQSLAARDQAVADETTRFLQVALDEPAVTGLMTWGLSDRYSWLTNFHDARNRGLPFDAELQKKPMWHSIAQALIHAPAHVASK